MYCFTHTAVILSVFIADWDYLKLIQVWVLEWFKITTHKTSSILDDWTITQEQERNWYGIPYLTKAIFQPSKMKLV